MAESTQRLSPQLKDEAKQVDWSAISGFRNILVHDYFCVDLELIWSVIEKRLPVLRSEIEKLIEMA